MYYPTYPVKPELSEIPGVMAERWNQYDRAVTVWNQWYDTYKRDVSWFS